MNISRPFTQLTLIIVTAALAVLSTNLALPQADEATPEATARPAPSLLADPALDDASLTTSEPCAPPCWRGITPGETGWDEALAIIEAAQDIAETEVQPDQETDAVGVVWRPVGSGGFCCRIDAVDGETVSFIRLRLEPTQTLEAIIAEFGEPDYAAATRSARRPDEAVVDLLFVDIPLLVTVFVPGADGDIDAASPVIGALYPLPADAAAYADSGVPVEWVGFAPLTTYLPAE